MAAVRAIRMRWIGCLACKWGKRGYVGEGTEISRKARKHGRIHAFIGKTRFDLTRLDSTSPRVLTHPYVHNPIIPSFQDHIQTEPGIKPTKQQSHQTPLSPLAIPTKQAYRTILRSKPRLPFPRKKQKIPTGRVNW